MSLNEYTRCHLHHCFFKTKDIYGHLNILIFTICFKLTDKPKNDTRWLEIRYQRWSIYFEIPEAATLAESKNILDCGCCRNRKKIPKRSTDFNGHKKQTQDMLLKPLA